MTSYYAKCHYAECNILFTIMLNVVMLIVIMLSVLRSLLRLGSNKRSSLLQTFVNYERKNFYNIRLRIIFQF